MTEAAAATPQPESAFLQIWQESFAQVFGQIAGAAFPFTLAVEKPSDLASAGEADLWAVITLSGSLRGEMSLRLPPAVVLRLAQIFMGESPTPEAQPGAEHREAVVELLRQVAGVVSTGGKAHWGEFQLLVETAASSPSWPSALTAWLQAGEPAAPISIEAVLSAALVAQLRAEKTEAARASPPAPPGEKASPAPGSAADTLDMLMDVQLAMTLRFGARTLLLREVLDLAPGSVIELDRRVQDPVELLLDGKLIGRGEVVVIEGSYGLRVTEISPPANT
jgi:flagellar motor switch protein FliN